MLTSLPRVAAPGQTTNLGQGDRNRSGGGGGGGGGGDNDGGGGGGWDRHFDTLERTPPPAQALPGDWSEDRRDGPGPGGFLVGGEGVGGA